MKYLCYTLWFVMALASAETTSCTVNSPDYRVTVVELFTSEGCNSCPPADRLLEKIATTIPTTQAIFLSQHVAYWDNLGWRDPFALPHTEPRQRSLANINRTGVYTPQFFINGWSIRLNGVDSILQSISQNRKKSSAVLLSIKKDGTKILFTWQNNIVLDGKLIWAITSAATESQVTAGENRNERLRHAEVVRWWQGPINTQSAQGNLTINLPNIADNGRGNIVLMMTQDHEIVQAVALSRQCAK